MRVKRTAAVLLRRRDHFAAVARQHVDRVAIHIAEYQVLRATGQHGNAVFSGSNGGSDRRNQLGREPVLDRWRHRFEFAQPFGQEFKDAAAPNKRLQAELLIQAQCPPCP